MTVKQLAWALALGAAVLVGSSACRTLLGSPGRIPHLRAAWTAWTRGDIRGAEAEARRLVSNEATADAGHFMLALTAHVRRDHREAIRRFEQVDPSSRLRGRLTEPILWSYVFAGDTEAALTLAEKMRLGSVTADRIRQAADNPLSVSIDGVVELPFTEDALSPYMPGFRARLNGREIVARLDTGGAFVHVSAEQAQALGIDTMGCDKGFASLSKTRICYGVADLDLGPVRMRNVPVSVHDDGLAAAPFARHFDARVDAIIGVNVLEQFLATVDGPRARLILSGRHDCVARRRHVSRIPEDPAVVPFGVWTDHLMIAKGEVAGRGPVNLFVDTGLVIVTAERGQAAVLASGSALASWGGAPVGDQGFYTLPGATGLAGMPRAELLAYAVSDRTWRAYGDWGGIEVTALIGWGYMKQFVWTIDFDRGEFLLATYD